ncbi:331_t:CDS:2, partial [Cetraspora pellucida]
ASESNNVIANLSYEWEPAYFYTSYLLGLRTCQRKTPLIIKLPKSNVNEIKSLLSNITDVNLRKITSRAKKVYIFYEGVGIDKISQITYSAKNDQDKSKTQSSAFSELSEAKVNASTEETKSRVSDLSISANSETEKGISEWNPSGNCEKREYKRKAEGPYQQDIEAVSGANKKLPPTISVSPIIALMIGIRCPLVRSWIGRCWEYIIGLRKVIVISHRSDDTITCGGGIIIIGLGGVTIVGLENG